jgi:hypothetical protein
MGAQRRTVALVEFLIDKTKPLDRLKRQLNESRGRALVRIFREGPEGFRGGLSAGNTARSPAHRPQPRTRDLAELVTTCREAIVAPNCVDKASVNMRA